MNDDNDTQIDEAVAQRQSQLQTMSLREVGRQFELAFDTRPDWPSGKAGLIERILAKFRAELDRNA